MMRTIVRIDGAGRIVVPRKLRDELHLAAGSMLQLERSGDRITLTPALSEARLVVEKGTPLIFPADTAANSVVTSEMVNEVVAKQRRQSLRSAALADHDEDTA